MRAPESQENTDTALAEIAWLSANNPHQVYQCDGLGEKGKKSHPAW